MSLFLCFAFTIRRRLVIEKRAFIEINYVIIVILILSFVEFVIEISIEFRVEILTSQSFGYKCLQLTQLWLYLLFDLLLFLLLFLRILNIGMLLLVLLEIVLLLLWSLRLLLNLLLTLLFFIDILFFELILQCNNKIL